MHMTVPELAGRRRLWGRIRGADAPCTGPNAAETSRPARLTEGEWPEIPLSVAGLSEEELTRVNALLFEPSKLGRRVAEEFMKIGEQVAGVKPLLAQAMPDHFHGILFVTREINRSLGSIMAGFKGKCSQIARELGVTQGITPRAPDPAYAPNLDARMAGVQHRWSGGAGRQPARITRAECLALNAIVAEICGGNAQDIVYRGLA